MGAGPSEGADGAAWLSYKANVPVLPIGFGDTRGKMAEAFQLKRPVLEMHVGDVLPPVQLNGELSKKAALQQAADEIMDAVWTLVPQEERQRKARRPEDEIFTFDIEGFGLLRASRRGSGRFGADQW